MNAAEAPADGTHECPGPECERRIGAELLACRDHWYQVPNSLRRAVYRAWAGGAGAGSAGHRKAMVAAIRAMRPLGAAPKGGRRG